MQQTNSIVQERTCWKCKDTFPLTSDHFYRDSKDSQGFQKRCKGCNAVFNRSYQDTNKHYFERKGRENYAKRKTTDPDYNKNRYQYSKDDYKRRRKERYATVEGRLYDLMKVAEGRALKASNPFDLDMPFLLGLWEAQNGCCLLTDIPFELQRNDDDLMDCQYYPYSPSIDQIEPGQGYIKSNVRLVCTAVNVAINQWKEETFERVAFAYVQKKVKTQPQIDPSHYPSEQ